MNEHPTSRFSNREEVAQIGDYRRVNIAGILALVLGLCSAVALTNTHTWVVNFVAVFAGVIGLRLARRNDNMGGAVPAWMGIVLGLFFVSWAASDFLFSRQVLYNEAQFVARNWLQLVCKGEDEIAHQAMLHPASRQPSDFSVDDYYTMDENAKTAKEQIFGSVPASDLMVMGDDVEIQLVKNITQDVDLKYGKLILQEYKISASNKEPVNALLTIARSYKEDLDRATWIVADISLPR